jgi:predicted GIY-YIG superfamily endonuclease
MSAATTNIYILRLQGGNYYVGKTADTTRRYQEHLAGTGSAWTRKHRPVALERVITNASPFDEDRYVKELMAKHGIDKVRGGAYVSEVLEDFQEEALRREIWGAANKCTICGRAGHFVKDCYARTDVEGNELLSESESESESESNSSSRSGSPQFYNPLYGLQVIKKQIVAKQAAYAVPVIKKVVAKQTNYDFHAPIVKKVVQKSQTCFRCGRAGHYVADCYALRHVRGYEID